MSTEYGVIEIYDKDRLSRKILINGDNGDIHLGGNGRDGDLLLFHKNVSDPRDHGLATIHLRGRNGDVVIGGNGTHGRIDLKNADGIAVVTCDADTGDISIGGSGKDGDIYLYPRGAYDIGDPDQATIRLNSRRGYIVLRSGGESPKDRVHISAETGDIWLGGNDVNGDLFIFPKDATNRGGQSNAEEATIHLDGHAGDIKLLGGDCAEYFPVVEPDCVDSGSVMVAQEAASLEMCSKAYDKRVVGVVSGAGELKPGIVMNKKVAQKNGVPLALVGTVLCKVDAQYARIEVGDLLTTSPTRGHAMKADDPVKSFGAVLGKALGSLASGLGLIPVLVTLR